MSFRVLLCLALVGLLFVGCSESDQPTATETEGERPAVEAEQAGEVSQVARTMSRVGDEAAQPEQPTGKPDQQRPDRTEGDFEPAPARTERRSSAQSESEQQSAPTEEQEESEVPPTGLTDVPATVVSDADVHVRPGLSWPVIARLSAGEEVAVLSAAGGWFRISFRDDREGWIRTPALDLGEVDPWWILKEPAPAIVAEWQGEQYGVMGQSADGAEIRLVPMDDGLVEIVSVPIDAVTLLASDISLHDLPIVIGDETVVFPGDDFRVGQGRILPKANEWMWLPWGWLLAHNDTHIWQWRPETDELEFAQRPAGPAKFSPDGQYLAIVSPCVEINAECNRAMDITILPLDGSPRLSLREQLIRSDDIPAVRWIAADSPLDLQWSPDSKALMIYVRFNHDQGWYGTALLFHIDGWLTQFNSIPEGVLDDSSCYFRELTDDAGDAWRIRDDNTVAAYVWCYDNDGRDETLDVVFKFNGELLQVGPSTYGAGNDDGAALIRTANGGKQLGEQLTIQWSPRRRYALVVDHAEVTVHAYSASPHEVRIVTVGPDGPSSPWEYWPPFDSSVYREALVWDVYWHDETLAAVMPRIGNDWIIAGLILDLTTDNGAVVEFGEIVLFTCLRTGVWNSDGNSFHVTVRTHRPVDGTEIGRRSAFRLLFFGLDGQLQSTFSSAASEFGDGPPHAAQWSPRGEWLAVGGQQRPSDCYWSA